MSDLILKTKRQLDDMYKGLEAGPIPQGVTKGVAILHTGTFISKLVALFIKLFVWKGKVFITDRGSNGLLLNKILPWGMKAVVAEVYRGESWMDRRPTIVIDYSRTSFFFQKVRDEIREIKPGYYLGKVWLGKCRVLDFTLTEE